jgi:hypothetical protein
MRRNILLILITLALASSCAALRAPAKLDRLANRVERRADHYTFADWHRANAKYDALVNEYIQNYGRYTRYEKQKAMAAIGRYHGVLADYGIKESVSTVGGIGAYAGGLLDILKQDVSAVRDFLKTVLGMSKKQIDSFIDEAK